MDKRPSSILRVSLVLAIVLQISCSRPPQDQLAFDPSHEPGTSALEGRWRMVDKRLGEAGLAIIWTFENNRAMVTIDDDSVMSDNAYQADPSHSPHHITLFIEDSGGKGERLGIYRVEKNSLVINWSMQPGVRPTSFHEDDSLHFERMYD